MTFVIGTPHTHHCGYLHTNSGGLKPVQTQADMQSCSHCQRAINLQAWRDNGAFCRKCMAPVCADGQCAADTEKYGCLPFLKKLEETFHLEGKLAQFRKVAGLDP